MHIRLFGPLQIETGTRLLGPRDLGGVRPKQVLELLLAARGHRVTTDRLAGALWGQHLPRNAASSLQTFVSTLRSHLSQDRLLAHKLVITEKEAYRFAPDLIDLDLDHFDELLERSAHEPKQHARRSLERALALVRGEVLEDEPYADWAEGLRRTYLDRVLGAHLEAADAALAELDYAGALIHTEAAVTLDRYSERAHRCAMLALYALGRQHEALQAYRRFRDRIDEDLGLEPTAGTRSLELAILRQEDVRALLPRPLVGTAALADARPVRLVGRAAELELLKRAVRHALTGSFAHLQIEGEAGLGKTRLLDELASTLVGVRVGRSRCSQLEQHLPYVPLAAALREALGRVELDARPLALRAILPELSRHEAAEEVAEVEALEALVELVAEHAPLVLFLDDLQWADARTIAAISYLQRRGAATSVALVTAVATEHAPSAHAIRSLKPDTCLRLEPLSSADLAPLGIPELHESTGGNPRFITAAIANGNRRELFAALAETVLAECRAEGARAHRILLAASVLEQPFEPDQLAIGLRIDETELIEELERLCERRILRFDGFRFRFRYQLVREVLLDSLSPARRRLLRERLRHSDEERFVASAG